MAFLSILKAWRKRANDIHPLSPRAFCPKRIFWTFWIFSGRILAKLSPFYSKRNLQHESKLLFSLASRFTAFSLGHAQAFPFLYFLSLSLLQWLTFYSACFPFGTLRESIIKTDKFCYWVATFCSRKFCSEFFTHWLDIGRPLLWALDHGELSNSQKQAITTLIEKEEKDRKQISDWRPISLINR